MSLSIYSTPPLLKHSRRLPPAPGGRSKVILQGWHVPYLCISSFSEFCVWLNSMSWKSTKPHHQATHLSIKVLGQLVENGLIPGYLPSANQA